MSAKTYQGDRAAIVTHAHPEGFNLCNRGDHVPNPFRPETPRSAVTCKRCLASLAKRDRHFRARARGWFAPSRAPLYAVAARARQSSENAARAIAAEEGRS